MMFFSECSAPQSVSQRPSRVSCPCNDFDRTVLDYPTAMTGWSRLGVPKGQDHLKVLSEWFDVRM